MEFYKDPLLMRQIIMQHFEQPNHKINHENIDSFMFSKRNKSTTCIDDITIYLDSNNNIVKTIKFDGNGCTISTSASDMLATILSDKTIVQSIEIIDNYINMIHNDNYDENLLEELNVFANIYKQPNRKSCALNAVESIKFILLGINSGK